MIVSGDLKRRMIKFQKRKRKSVNVKRYIPIPALKASVIPCFFVSLAIFIFFSYNTFDISIKIYLQSLIKCM